MPRHSYRAAVLFGLLADSVCALAPTQQATTPQEVGTATSEAWFVRAGGSMTRARSGRDCSDRSAPRNNQKVNRASSKARRGQIQPSFLRLRLIQLVGQQGLLTFTPRMALS
jgi:hypothetical protein